MDLIPSPLRQLEGLRRFLEDHPKVPAFVLGHKQNRRQLATHITVMNWDDFMRVLLRDVYVENETNFLNLRKAHAASSYRARAGRTMQARYRV